MLEEIPVFSLEYWEAHKQKDLVVLTCGITEISLT